MIFTQKPINDHGDKDNDACRDVLEEGIAWIAGAVAGQPKGSAARLLSSIIARLLHSHYNKLLAEANQWME